MSRHVSSETFSRFVSFVDPFCVPFHLFGISSCLHQHSIYLLTLSGLLLFRCGVCSSVVVVSQCVLYEHLVTSWLECIILGVFGSFSGDFGIAAISEEI